MTQTRAWSSCGLQDAVKRRRLDGEASQGVSDGWRHGGGLRLPSRRALHVSTPRLRAELAQGAKATETKAVTSSQGAAPTDVGAEDAKERRRRDIEILRKLLPNIWPRGENGAKARVVLALGFLVAGKLLNVQVPFFFKNIVDQLNIPLAELSSEQTVYTLAGTAIVGCASSRPAPR